MEAQKKFNDKGLNNVCVETAHSIAYKYTVSKFGYRIRTQEYKSTDVVECLELSVNGGEKHDVYVIANHILKLAAYFCNSDKEKVSELDYLSLIQEADAKAFVQKNYEFIELQTRTFLGMMNKGEIEITHDFYLKRFQLLKPQLPFDYILFDEGQDASAAMLDVFFRQRATKVIVGDTHQQIYSWRFAVNSLEKADFTTYQLSKSFRFPQEIAVLAQAVLQRKELLGEYKAVDISGLGRSTEIKVKAILARTNLGLLIRAIEFVTGKKDLGSIYFEGNINSYMYADEGASLYDILNLYNGEKKNIRDKLIRNMRDVVELEDYIDKTEDAQLGMMLEIIKEYGNRIPGILKSIKEKHVENSERDKAEIIFSTVHRCKGLEYDVVQLVDDFTTEDKIEKMMASGERNEIFLSKLNEEINLLYVAVTRAKNQLIIPIDLLPHEIEPSYRIRVIRPELEETDNQKSGKNNQKAKSQNKSFTKTNQSNSNAYNPWTEYMDEELTTLYLRGECIEDLSAYFSRTPSSIKSRLKKLGLE